MIAWLTAALGSGLGAQDLGGEWQGALKAGANQLRIIVKIAKADSGWNAKLFSIDQGPDFGAGMAFDTVSLQGSEVKMTLDAIRGKFEGKLSADGATLAGTWTQGLPLPFELKRATPETAFKDPATHSLQFVTVDKDVKLEVLDWGGSGKPMVFLSGLGNSGHVFDKFAPKFTSQYHVYGITRRGYGASSVPASGYAADRLGDDVIAVLDALKLERPVLVGHSIAGEELSSIGSRHPERVAGMVYLDAGYWYAFYDKARGSLSLDLVELQRKLEALAGQPGSLPLIKELLETTLPGFERDLREEKKSLETMPAMLRLAQGATMPSVAKAIISGGQKYTKIPVPILAIYAVPHGYGAIPRGDEAARAAQDAHDEESTGAQATAFEQGVPSARVVRLAHADHFVFVSNEADVLREMNAFLAGLVPQIG